IQDWSGDHLERHFDRGLEHEEAGLEVAREILAAEERPDAIFVGDDIHAKGVAMGLLQFGIEVPREIAFLTMANSNSGVTYPVEAIRIEYDLLEMARRAGEMLIDFIRNPEAAPVDQLVTPALRLPSLPTK
ncbi:MAG: substrate-binding domain-containing protein, partial [Planctomycetota bacterium]